MIGVRMAEGEVRDTKGMKKREIGRLDYGAQLKYKYEVGEPTFPNRGEPARVFVLLGQFRVWRRPACLEIRGKIPVLISDRLRLNSPWSTARSNRLHQLAADRQLRPGGPPGERVRQKLPGAP
eukprot:SAG22_NODE_14727_length_366_cov_1.910112_1_plen_122_part_11